MIDQRLLDVIRDAICKAIPGSEVQPAPTLVWNVWRGEAFICVEVGLDIAAYFLEHEGEDGLRALVTEIAEANAEELAEVKAQEAGE